MTSTPDSAPAVATVLEYDAFAQAGGGFVMREPAGLYRHDGPDALDLLQRITTNDLTALTPGTARRTVIADDRGRVVDVPWVVMRAPDDLLLITDLRDTNAFERAILKYTIIEDACLTGLSGQLSRMTLIGNASERYVKDALGIAEFSEIEVGQWTEAGDATFLKSSFGDESAWEVVLPSSQIDSRLAELESELVPLSEETFHAIRVANGIPWPGCEMTQLVNPLECGLMELIDFDKGCYVGQEVIARLDTYDKVQRKLVKLRLAEGNDPSTTQAPPIGTEFSAADSGRKVGWVSSTGIDPSNGSWVGLGFVRNAHSAAGTRLAPVDGDAELIVVA